MRSVASAASSQRVTRTAIVLAGGDPVAPPLPRALPDPALVIAADSGFAAAAPLGLEVDLLVGDLDSISPADLALAHATGVRIDQHPTDKDRTDLALALDAAVAAGATDVMIVGGAGGRLDHLLGGLLLLASDAYQDLRVVGLIGHAVLTVIRAHAELPGRPGELISLLPAHGSASGIATTGLRYPLDDGALDAGSSRGVSNEFAAPLASVTLEQGVLLAVQPDAGPDPTPGGTT